jgi:hypothetical protein
MTEQELASATEPPAEAAKVYEPEAAGEAVASANEAHENGAESPPVQRCKFCERDALPLSLFCKGHQEHFVQNGAKKAGLRRLDVLLVAVLIGLLWLYPTVQRPEWVTSHDAGVWGSFSALYSRLTGRKSAPRADAGGKTAEAPSVRRSKKSLAAGGAACGNGVLDSGELCDGKALGGASCASLGFAGDCGSDSGCLHPSLACLGNCRFDYSGCTAESQAALQRFVDNGDATATDRLTGLTWELKCVTTDCQTEHDVVAKLPWQEAGTRWVSALNAARFAGHDDWRLPSLEELRTLLTAVPPCATPPCPAAAWPRDGTAAAGYWSSTSFSLDRGRAWAISFGDGEAYTAAKDATLYVRAVRDGS